MEIRQRLIRTYLHNSVAAFGDVILDYSCHIIEVLERKASINIILLPASYV